jgi:hypothetical protein
MFPGRSAIMLLATATLVLILPILGPGCGADVPEYDKAADYTPESLAQELIIRYRTLNPDVRTARRAPKNKKSGARNTAPDETDKKGAVRTPKKRVTTTIDDVLEDIDTKIELVKGTSPTETLRKMTQTIASDGSLSDSEKKALTDLVDRLAD